MTIVSRAQVRAEVVRVAARVMRIDTTMTAWRLYRLYRTHSHSRRASLKQVWRCLRLPIN